MSSPLRDREKKPEFFRSLPSELTIDILSRLPIRTIAICKSVSKPWLNLLRSRQFANFHLPTSASGLVIGGGEDDEPSKKYNVFEFDDERGFHENYSPLTKFDSVEFTGHSAVMQGSAGGCFYIAQPAPDTMIFTYAIRSPASISVSRRVGSISTILQSSPTDLG